MKYGVIVEDQYTADDGWGGTVTNSYEYIKEFNTELELIKWIEINSILSSSYKKIFRAIRFEELEVKTSIKVDVKLSEK